jgi:hypothetical protein
MNPPRDSSAIVAAWLEEGPTELPESTRRAIAVDVRTTHQSRRSVWAPRWFHRLDRLTLAALAALTVMALVVGGLVVRPFASGGSNVGGLPPVPSASPAPSPSEAPSAAPIPTTLVIPAMSDLYTSRRFGYSVLYPADWSVEQATQTWSPPDWKADDSPGQPFDYISDEGEVPVLRAASALVPEGLANVNDWIDEFLIFGDPNCVPPRETQEVISIDGAPGRIWDGCGEVEATIVLEGRVYMFTLFVDQVTNGRELFDALAATIDLRPEHAALASPSP